MLATDRTLARHHLDVVVAMFDGRQIAFTAVSARDDAGHCFGLAVAEVGARDVSPVPIRYCRFSSYEAAVDHANTINTTVLGLSRDAAARVITGTMRPDVGQDLRAAARAVGTIVPAAVLAMEASLRILLSSYRLADVGMVKATVFDRDGNWQIACGRTYTVIYVAAPSGEYSRQGWVAEATASTRRAAIIPEDGGSVLLAFLPLTAGPEDLFAEIMRAHAAEMLERATMFDVDARDSVAETPFGPTTALAEADG